jgi:hypothetical protein
MTGKSQDPALENPEQQARSYLHVAYWVPVSGAAQYTLAEGVPALLMSVLTTLHLALLQLKPLVQVQVQR